jgi:hypothetical protein
VNGGGEYDLGRMWKEEVVICVKVVLVFVWVAGDEKKHEHLSQAGQSLSSDSNPGPLIYQRVQPRH